MRIATIIALGFSLLLTDRNGSEAGDPPAGGAVFQTDAQKAAFKTHLSDILVEGLARQQASVKTTDDRVASARRLTTDRAPLEHAYGLVLLRRLKYRDALAQFVSASDSTELPFLPAWRARIVLRLKLKDRSGFSTDLRKLATLTMDESHPWADSAQRLDAAGLIGRFAAFAALPEVKLIPSAEADAVQPVLDRLRADGRVIRVLRPVRESLEDLFMRYVHDPETGKAKAPGAIRKALASKGGDA